jgi:hypothetical protein
MPPSARPNGISSGACPSVRIASLKANGPSQIHPIHWRRYNLSSAFRATVSAAPSRPREAEKTRRRSASSCRCNRRLRTFGARRTHGLSRAPIRISQLRRGRGDSGSGRGSSQGRTSRCSGPRPAVGTRSLHSRHASSGAQSDAPTLRGESTSPRPPCAIGNQTAARDKARGAKPPILLVGLGTKSARWPSVGFVSGRTASRPRTRSSKRSPTAAPARRRRRPKPVQLEEVG